MIWLVLISIIFNNCNCLNDCQKTDRYCYCDDKCIMYGDCCSGHPYYNKTGLKNDILICQQYSLINRIWVINKCSDRNHRLAEFCTKNSVPPLKGIKSLIQVITNDNKVYKNAFCAICNNEKKFQYVNSTVKCFNNDIRTFQDISKAINKTICNFTPVNSNQYRFCNKNYVRKCPSNYKLQKNYNYTIIEKCENMVANLLEDVTDGRELYRNIYCCACWNKTCFKRVYGGGESYGSGFTYFLNFNEWDDENIDDLTQKTLSSIKNVTVKTFGDRIIFYTSFIFTIFSIFSLLILIGIYSYHVIFHNFGGYLTICLSCCLLLLNFMLLFSSFNFISESFLCKYFAILQHYIALSNFIWMAIYALNLFQTFGFKTRNKNKKKSFLTFIVYMVIGFGLAALIVGISTVVDITVGKNSTIRPNYGGENCWFRSKLGGIIWYFGPVCFLLLWNFIACIIVFYKLSKTTKECRIVQQKESNKTLWLCIRLTAVFGIGYFFQIIAVFSGVKALIVIGSLINCLQGCLLSACFIWTKRVRTAVTLTFTSLQNSNTTSQNINTKITGVPNDDDN